jgi:hypothetical protein
MRRVAVPFTALTGRFERGELDDGRSWTLEEIGAFDGAAAPLFVAAGVVLDRCFTSSFAERLVAIPMGITTAPAIAAATASAVALPRRAGSAFGRCGRNCRNNVSNSSSCHSMLTPAQEV